MASMQLRAKAIKALEQRGGQVTAAALVKAAASPKHALHNEFEWDDTKAGAKYRLDQARGIIASVRINRMQGERRVSSVAYIRNPTLPSAEPGYVSITRLRTEGEAAEDALRQEVDRIQSCIERAREIAGALDLVGLFDDLLEAAITLRARMRRGPTVSTDEPRPDLS